ncbi:hypothetical protein [Moraxella boevrei]|uniref:hypothetical protein n=1 Tax=Faucicola boevrei TaxID=346665 RepID=UPI00373636E7
MSALVEIFIKPNCEKSIQTLDMISEWGNIDEVIVVGNLDEYTKNALEKEIIRYQPNEVSYISEEEFGEEELPQVVFDQSLSLNYEELVGAYEEEDLDQYFT